MAAGKFAASDCVVARLDLGHWTARHRGTTAKRFARARRFKRAAETGRGIRTAAVLVRFGFGELSARSGYDRPNFGGGEPRFRADGGVEGDLRARGRIARASAGGKRLDRRGGGGATATGFAIAHARYEALAALWLFAAAHQSGFGHGGRTHAEHAPESFGHAAGGGKTRLCWAAATGAGGGMRSTRRFELPGGTRRRDGRWVWNVAE